MAFNLNPLTAISQEVRAWRESNNKLSKEKQQEMKLAITALSKAILETKVYVRNGLDNRIPEKENEIRDLWNLAHIELKHIDADLASRCFSKAEYWTEPDHWDDKMVTEYNITLDSMSESLKEL